MATEVTIDALYVDFWTAFLRQCLGWSDPAVAAFLRAQQALHDEFPDWFYHDDVGHYLVGTLQASVPHLDGSDLLAFEREVFWLIHRCSNGFRDLDSDWQSLRRALDGLVTRHGGIMRPVSPAGS